LRRQLKGSITIQITEAGFVGGRGDARVRRGDNAIAQSALHTVHLRELTLMPRLARLDASGILHHVMERGIERNEIFFNDTDRRDFIDRLAALVEEGVTLSQPGYSGADVARYLGVTNSCVTRFVASGKKPDVDDLIRKLCTLCTMSPFSHFHFLNQ